ncbi:hypothetical protein SUNI508_12345 [Seiridium unicorne]|uniref:Uncharacterized protein n=1 Tax=Seiridium unicorne TaxID=138068 RepID=A0ABR2UEA7_9PEZI
MDHSHPIPALRWMMPETKLSTGAIDSLISRLWRTLLPSIGSIAVLMVQNALVADKTRVLDADF